MSVKAKRIILTLLMIPIMGIPLYLFASDLWNQYVNNQMFTSYTESVQSEESVNNMLIAAQEYNRNLITSVTNSLSSQNSDTELYESLLNTSESGIMGYISIPKISINLPIYHYTTDESLKNGVGHMYGTSLPVGGESTHSVLSAHRGLPTALLFTNLDQMEIGDVFYLNILGDILAYEVYNIETVLPEELDSLTIQTSEDIVTLVTCTPYGVNTHRLLVHAKRTELTDVEKESAITTFEPYYTISWDLLVLIIIEFAAYLYAMRAIKKNSDSEVSEEEILDYLLRGETDEDYEDI